MGKFRSKLKGQTKGKRWKKGQSSSSNPETKKHREIAKSRFFQENLDASGLTSDALKKHDAVQSSLPLPPKIPSQTYDEDIVSLGNSFETLRTFASDWSECSNVSFGRLMRVFRVDSAHHKEMLAILAALTEVIKQNGGQESSTEYYAALMTTLEEISESKEEKSVTAVVSLLSMVIKSVPRSVLQAQFSNACAKLLSLLNEYSSADNNAVVKSVIVCLAVFLRAQNLPAWKDPFTMQVFEAVLRPYCIHSKPKWRKQAQQAVGAVLKASSFQIVDGKETRNKIVVVHPGSALVADFCITTIEESFGTSAQEIKVAGKGKALAGQTTLLHVFEIMKEVIHTFPKQSIKTSCETILKIMTLKYPLVTSCGLQVLYQLFSAQTAAVPAKLNAQLITALYDYQPAVTDVQPTTAWLLVMQQAHIHLADVDSKLSVAALPKIVTTCTQLWLSEKPEIMFAATRSLETLLKDAVAPICENERAVNDHTNGLSKCFQTIESGLGYQFNKAWPQVLHVISIMFQVAGSNCSQLLVGCLKSLAELRDSYKFSYNNELEHAVGAAIRFMGPQVVLDVISIKKENNVFNLERSWLLPVLKENVQNKCTLLYFINTVLPLTIHCQKHAVQLSQASDTIGAHSYELLYTQLWNLLPSFCNAPTDISSNFKNVAKVMGTAISDRKELRLAVMAALRRLIAFSKSDEANENDKTELARFGKNYLPILFNVYTTRPIGTDEEGQRLAALDTIKLYLTVVQPELSENLFVTALERYNGIDASEPNDQYLKESLLDLLKILCIYQTTESVSLLYKDLIKKLHENSNNKEQKKLYRLLEEVCSNDAIGCKEFVSQNRKDVQKLLMKSLDTTAVSSKGARLRCLLCLVKAQPQLDHESKFLQSIIPEAVLCCKDINEKCRATAFQLLVAVGELLQNHNQIHEYVAMVLAGLAGSPAMMSATILALASLFHNFSGALGQNNIQQILDNVFTMQKTATREIVGACLSFVKVYMSSFPAMLITASLPKLVQAICGMTEDNKRHFRTKVRDILDKLVRKFGCDSLEPHIPETDVVMKKRLKNLRKINAKKKMRKEAKHNDDDEDGEWENESFVSKAKPKTIDEILAESDSDLDAADVKSQKQETKKQQKRKKTTNTWIQEDEDNIVDFTDPSATSKITATRPGVNVQATQGPEKNDKNRGFKTANDGRLIIEDGSDSDTGKKTRKANNYSDDSDSDGDKRSAAETLILGSGKRKRDDATSEYSGANGRAPSKYKTGGSGIHRSVPSSKAASVSSYIGSEYKSKKAKGDVKKAGKLDPYAYLPLNRSTLNKRKKMKSVGQFKSIVKGSKTGAAKGSKIGKKRKL